MADENQNLDEINDKLNKLTDAVSKMTEGVSAIQQNHNQLAGYVSQLAETQNSFFEQASAYQQSGDDDDDDAFSFDLGDKSLEDLSQTEVVQLMMGQVQKMLEHNNKALRNDLSNVQNTVQKSSVAAELQQVVNSNPDFPYWKDEVKSVLSEKPQLSIEDAFILAKNRNPEKQQQVEQQMKEDTAGKENPKDGGENNSGKNENKGGDGSEKKQTKGFGGLTPTSGQSEGNPTNMQPTEAAEAAWSEAMDGIDLGEG